MQRPSGFVCRTLLLLFCMRILSLKLSCCSVVAADRTTALSTRGAARHRQGLQDVVEKAAEHLDPTTIMAAETAVGFFVHCKLVVESPCLSKNQLNGPTELR